MQTTLTCLQENKVESSQPKLRNPPLLRNSEARHNQLVNHYFVDDAVYVVKFRRRFRTTKEIFLYIVDDIKNRFL